MIYDACASTAFVTPFTHSRCLFSDATSAASQCVMLEDLGIFLVLADKVWDGWF